jgi:hypothetical protein
MAPEFQELFFAVDDCENFIKAVNGKIRQMCELLGFRMRPNQYGYRAGVFGALQIVLKIAYDKCFAGPNPKAFA